MQRHIEAERLGGLEVDEDFEFRWMLHGQIGGFYAPEYLISIDCPLSELIDRIEAIGDQSKRFLAEA
jgi:hypothetical protein